MTEQERPKIADSQKSPMDEAAEDVSFGPPAYTEEDKEREEPPGTSEAPERPTDEADNPPPASTSGGM